MYAKLAAEALFASPLQPSDNASNDEVRRAIKRRLAAADGSDGCAVTVAGEYGEHPDSARARMGWALEMVQRRSHRVIRTIGR